MTCIRPRTLIMDEIPWALSVITEVLYRCLLRTRTLVLETNRTMRIAAAKGPKGSLYTQLLQALLDLALDAAPAVSAAV